MAGPGGLGPGGVDSYDGPQSNKSLHRGILRFETTNPNHKMNENYHGEWKSMKIPETEVAGKSISLNATGGIFCVAKFDY